ncbi:toll/interleukin-1 receptor domain-containing protein [Nocardia sp. NPDC051833]|uniref:toll/interleukin-1 receptor domain-containing protein n=1 Tax=Nocardia sp. NPDC051833 TaxID=3155674 RepID=UPI00341DB4EE
MVTIESAARRPGMVFLSYRREDTQHVAGRLFDRLTDRFGDDRVFMDIDSIEPGVDFTEVVADAIGRCTVLLALIGQRWATVTNTQGQRRLDTPGDLVAAEIAAALSRNIRVISVLVDGAAMPSQAHLPPALQTLAFRNAVHLRHETFRADTTRLLDTLEKAFQPPSHGPTSTGRPPAATPARSNENRTTRSTGTEPATSARRSSSQIHPNAPDRQHPEWAPLRRDEGRSARLTVTLRADRSITYTFTVRTGLDGKLHAKVDGTKRPDLRRELRLAPHYRTRLHYDVRVDGTMFRLVADRGEMKNPSGMFRQLLLIADGREVYNDFHITDRRRWPTAGRPLPSQGLAVAEALWQFGIYPGIDTFPEISASRESMARTYLGIPAQEAILCLVDRSPALDGSECAAFTERGVYDVFAKAVRFKEYEEMPRWTVPGVGHPAPPTITFGGTRVTPQIVDEMFDAILSRLPGTRG